MDGGRPIKNWAADIEDGAREQAINVSRLPFVVAHVALMPDAHQGYGMPVGGVFMADKAIVPYAIGVDIGCGVTLLETSLMRDDLDGESITALLHQVSRDVPVGNGPRGGHRGLRGEPFMSSQHLHDTLDLRASVGDHLPAMLNDAENQLGTLGGGNHFLELQYGEDDGRVYFMIHSGSRSLGKKICDRHHKIALAKNKEWHSDLPHPEVAFLPWTSGEALVYWEDMSIALEWAEENRRRMAGAVISAFGRVLNAKAWQTIDIHHNYAAWENHFGKNGIVHRKGAVRAQLGDTVLIPGSMSTGSYIAKGLGNYDALMTCQHGAGRARSRAATRKLISKDDMDRMLDDAGVILVTPDRASVTDESAPAYKDIESVMAASTDLVEPIQRLRPLGVVKG
jgi:tRNA-splicing ligase RtcB (3'-phosphate/5'-hydroxy nucleic acid ligase)